jgi:hypothetical protein
VDDAVLCGLLRLVVVEETGEGVFVLGQEVDGVDLVEFLAFEGELLDGGDAEIDELHHLHEAAEDFKGEVVGDEDEGHGVGLGFQGFEHQAEFVAAGLF